MRVGFLFNHYAPHQVPHAAPFAFELSRLYPEIEVVIACSTPEERAFADAIGNVYPGHRATFRSLGISRVHRLLDWSVSSWSFVRKRFILGDNLDFFRSLNALVTPERYALKLRGHADLGDLKIIHTRHGAGDREGGFDSRCADFDFTLLPGQKYVDRLRDHGFLRTHAVVGWPKFEAVQRLKPKPERLFDHDRPTVVYAPHFDERVSSWQTMGEDVLAFFADSKDYNLIFAPHVVLFKRRWRHGARLPKGYDGCANILIDTGSLASADMTYMRAADIYLGDASSQVYEFLLDPRPCIFLNAHDVDWRQSPHYPHFSLGQVIDDVKAGLGPALERAISGHGTFKARQEDAISYTFKREADSTAAERGAVALANFLQTAADKGCLGLSPEGQATEKPALATGS